MQPGSVGVDVLTLKPRLPLPIGRVKEHRVGVDAVDTPPEIDEEEGGSVGRTSSLLPARTRARSRRRCSRAA